MNNYRFFTCFIALWSTLCMTSPIHAWKGQVTVSTPNTQLLLHADEGSDLRMDYYGPRSCTLDELRDAGAAFNYPALPAFGSVEMVQLPAIQIQHADGDLNLEPVVEAYDSKAEEDATIHIFTMKDKLQPLTIRLFYKAYNKVDIIETWTEIVNAEKKAITLKRFDSGHLVIRQGDVWITHMPFHSSPSLLS